VDVASGAEDHGPSTMPAVGVDLGEFLAAGVEEGAVQAGVRPELAGLARRELAVAVWVARR
jgi:hypothetical protein